jgi:hypothetical protein
MGFWNTCSGARGRVLASRPGPLEAKYLLLLFGLARWLPGRTATVTPHVE